MLFIHYKKPNVKLFKENIFNISNLQSNFC